MRPDAILRPGDICINSTGTGTIGRVGLWSNHLPGTYFADTHVTIIRPVSSLVSSKFLSESLSSSEIQRLMEVSCFSGSTHQVELDRSSLRALDLLIPPLGEQRKIAAILSSLDDTIETTQEVIGRLEALKKATLAELLTRGIPGRHRRFRTTEAGRAPKDWRIVRLGAITSIGNGTTPAKARPDYWLAGDTPWLPTGKVNERVIRSADEFITSKALKDTGLRLLPKHTVLVAMIGQGKTRGKVAISELEATVNQNFAYVLAGPLVRPLFLFARLEADYELLRSSGRGSNQDALNCSIVKSFPIALPDLEEQDAIIQVFMGFEARLEAERIALEALYALKSGLLPALLAGEIRVTPNEGPA